MNEQFQVDTAEAVQASISMNISTFNGIFAIAAALARRGLLSSDDVKHLHNGMLQPLNNDGVPGELMALQVRRIDELCSTLAVTIDKLFPDQG